MEPTEEITSLIPHRPPFLWVDRIICFSGDTIETETTIRKNLDLFEGHYPANPIMPGVLLCEAIFQSGALLMAKQISGESSLDGSLPVLTRINGAKFKRSVTPGDICHIRVTVTEKLSSAVFFKGTLKVGGKTAVQVDFACTMARPSAEQ